MLTDAFLMVIEFVIGFFITLLLVRFLMQWQRISFRNQLGNFVVVTTNGLLKPVRRLIPGWYGLDVASVLLAWMLALLWVLILRGSAPSPFSSNTSAVFIGLISLSLLELMIRAIYLIFVVVIASAIFSWVAPHLPAAGLCRGLAAPFLRPFQRLIPLVANIDLSPLALLLVLQILLMFVKSWSGRLAFMLY